MSMRNFIKIVEKAEWKVYGKGPEELCIGGQIIQINPEKKSAQMDGGPFYSGFDLKGDTEEELKADAIRQGYEQMKKSLREFEETAKEMGIDLGGDQPE